MEKLFFHNLYTTLNIQGMPTWCLDNRYLCTINDYNYTYLQYFVNLFMKVRTYNTYLKSNPNTLQKMTPTIKQFPKQRDQFHFGQGPSTLVIFLNLYLFKSRTLPLVLPGADHRCLAGTEARRPSSAVAWGAWQWAGFVLDAQGLQCWRLRGLARIETRSDEAGCCSGEDGSYYLWCF